MKQRSYKASVINRTNTPYVEPKDSFVAKDKEGDMEPTKSERQRLEEIRKHDQLKNINAFQSVEDRIARSSLFIQYHVDNKLKEYFSRKTDTRFRQNLFTIDKYYEWAYRDEGGTRQRAPLYIDKPQNEWAIKDCESKAKACKELGIRYAFILAGDTMDVVLMRLGEI